MSNTRRSGGGWITNTVNRRRSGGGWAEIQNGYRRSGGGWALVYSALSGSAAGVNTNFNNGNTNSPATRGMSSTATAYASGGGTITYNWWITSSSNVTSPTISGVNSATCGVQGTVRINVPGIIYLACTISNGGASVTVTTQVTLNYFSTL